MYFKVKSKWGSVEVQRPNSDVYVSFNRGDRVAMEMIARWFGVTYDRFLRLIPEGPSCLNCGQPKYVHGTDGRPLPDACEWDMQTMYYRGLDD